MIAATAGGAPRILLYSVTDRREAGGAQRVIYRLSDDLAARGWRVRRAWAGPGAADGRDEDAVCPLHLRAGWREWHAPSLARAAALLARTRPDVVNVHFLSEQALYFLRLAPVFGYRTVLSAHGTDLRLPAPAWRARLPEMLRRADCVTVVSRDLAVAAQGFAALPPERLRVTPNGVDATFWTPGDRLERPAGPPHFAAAGRLEPVKGFDLLLDAFARLRTDAPDARLTIAGEGPEAASLAAQARTLGVADAVDMPGRLGPEALRELFRSATAFVLSSRSEGMPLALLEAMACGAAPIAAAVGGAPDLVTAETGLSTQPEDAGALAEAMTALARDPKRARVLGAAAQMHARRFSTAAAAEAYEAAYAVALEAAERAGRAGRRAHAGEGAAS